MFPARGKVVTFADSCSLRAVLPPDGAFWREGPGGGGGPEADLDLIQGVCSLPLSLGRRQVSPCVRLNTSCRCVCRVTDFRRVTSTLQHCPARGWVGGLSAAHGGAQDIRAVGSWTSSVLPSQGDVGPRQGQAVLPSPHVHTEMGQPTQWGFLGAQDARDRMAVLTVGQGRLGKEPSLRKRQQIAVRA